MRVLVIDDDAVIGSLVRLILTREGYDVEVHEDGVAGLRAAGEVAPDLVLVDSKLPGMSGDEVTEALAADPATASVPVVRMSADHQSVHGGLRKPFRPAELVELVRRHLG